MSCGDAAEAGPSTGPDEQKLMPRKKTVRRAEKGICQRCHENKTRFVIRTVTYCEPCFRQHIVSRLVRQMHPPLRVGETTRSIAMSKQRPPKVKGNALIAVSGGAGSMTLIDILTGPRYNYVARRDAEAFDKTKGVKAAIWDQGTMVYVEFCGVVEGTADRTEDMRRLADERGLGFLALRAEDVFDPTLGERLGRNGEGRLPLFADLSHPELPVASSSTASSSRTPLKSLRNLLSSLPPPSRPSLLARVLDHLLTLAANTLPDIAHLILGETSSRQAERIISGTALGRGWALPLELAAAYRLPSLDQQESRVTQLKPLKDVTIREAAIWCHLTRLPTINSRGWGSVKGKDDGKRDARGKGGVASLEMLTEQFIAGLSVTHPSTVSTINRTGEKLVFPGDAMKELCPVCEHPVDPSALDWKSRTALMSLPTKEVEPTTTMSDSTSDRLAPLLCYSCLTTFTPARIGQQADAAPVMLPLWVGERVSAQSMKDQIGEFLLDDDIE